MAKGKKSVTISLNEEEAEDLVRLVFLGSWMSGAYDPDPSMFDEEQTAQSIYKAVHESGVGVQIQYAKELEKYFVGKSLESDLYEDVIHEYNEITFVEKLCEFFVEKETKKKYGPDYLEKVDQSKLMVEALQLHEKYQEKIYEDYDELMDYISKYFDRKKA